MVEAHPKARDLPRVLPASAPDADGSHRERGARQVEDVDLEVGAHIGGLVAVDLSAPGAERDQVAEEPGTGLGRLEGLTNLVAYCLSQPCIWQRFLVKKRQVSPLV